ncbi:MAG TPA: sulfotransferase [Ktedonobacteraceae bacterium]|jgi:hypothetical protein
MSDTSPKPALYFFCIGGQKTGTPLLARLFDSLPQVACLWESYAINPLHNTSILNPDSLNRIRHGFKLDFIKDLRAVWQLDTRDYFFDIEHRYRSFSHTMPQLLNDFAQRNGATIVGDKWPWYIRHLKALLQTFPDAKLIHSIRDPRAIWNSAQRFLARERGDVVLWEIMELEKMLESYNLAKDRLFTVRYEDILADPITTLTKLGHFLNVPVTMDAAAAITQSNSTDPRWSWVPEAMMPVTASHGEKWKMQMPRERILWVQQTAAWLFQKYEYSFDLL